jgi:hypothetical protein
MKLVLDGFMNDLKGTVDDVTGRPLDQDTLIHITGDTPKTPYNRGGWGDGTPQNSNWAYVYSAGNLYSGWYGGADGNGRIDGFDGNGNTTAGAYDANATARLANASIAYAIAKRDERAIQQFANGTNVLGIFGPAPGL